MLEIWTYWGPNGEMLGYALVDVPAFCEPNVFRAIEDESPPATMEGRKPMTEERKLSTN